MGSEMSENWRRMLAGELYTAFTPEMVQSRLRCEHACNRFNNAGKVSRRRLIELMRDVLNDKTPLPPKLDDEEADAAQFEDEPWIQSPIRMDYGSNVTVGKGAFVNYNCVFADTCSISIGARTLVGPGVSFLSATHPLDPLLRNGTKGPELGKPIVVEEDCWIAANVTLLPGVTIGRGATVGAGSVVTKDVPAFHVAAGNPARVIRRIETQMDPEQAKDAAAKE